MKVYIVAFMNFVLCAVQASRATEFGEVKFVLLVHRDVAVGKVLGRIPDSNDTASGNRLFPCANTYVGMTPRMIVGKLKRYGPQEWVDRRTVLGEAKRHDFAIRNNDYFPPAMIIQAGDTITDPEFGKVKGSEVINSFKVENLQRNLQFSASVKDYRIPQAESWPLKICNGTHFHRLSYVFVMNHNIGNLSDQNGSVTLTDLPCDVALPMQLQYPWLPLADFRLKCSTLCFDEYGRFDVTLNMATQNRHVIHILPAERIEK